VGAHHPASARFVYAAEADGRIHPENVIYASGAVADHGAMAPRRVSLLAFPGLQPLDLTGPHEIFAMANDLAQQRDGRPAYRLEVLARKGGLVRARSGLSIAVDRTFTSVRGRIDTLLVVGGEREGVRAAVADGVHTAFLARMAPRVRRIGSVCSGAFLLAAAGLLDGRRATTHWASSETLAALFPRVEVDADAIWVKDGCVYTSAGVTAGIDLALALVEEDLGREAALAVARRAVVFLKRPGGQSQFSAELAAQIQATGPLERLPDWIRRNLAADLDVETLARRVGMSPRNFARVFRRQFETTPARFVERARVEHARRHLEEARLSLDEIADACGFGSGERMRRSFARVLGVGPAAYRERFEKPRLRRAG
jgi:transcriptional regulator GlxA family with amidase domain